MYLIFLINMLIVHVHGVCQYMCSECNAMSITSDSYYFFGWRILRIFQYLPTTSFGIFIVFSSIFNLLCYS